MTTLTTRLAALPPNVGAPLKKLLAADQLTETILESILDAAELTHDYPRLLPFTAGFVYLQSQGVPVADAIAMAKKQRRRIRLTWSRKRWQVEHDRFARAETLSRLSAENVAYDVSAFEKYLPRKFNGYLIRSSRRLGMEGLRQQHCVASYHERLLAKDCAIACVFIAKTRWTVELVLTGNAKTPIQITQIKKRFNIAPSAPVRDAVHEALNSWRLRARPLILSERNAISGRARATLPTTRSLGGRFCSRRLGATRRQLRSTARSLPRAPWRRCARTPGAPLMSSWRRAPPKDCRPSQCRSSR